MLDIPLLTTLIFSPLIGVALMLCARGAEADVAKVSRRITFLTTLVTFLISLKVLLIYGLSLGDFRLDETFPLVESLGITYRLGVDGLAMALIMLTTFLMPVAVLATSHVSLRVREYMIAFLLLEVTMIGTFCALDTFLFYIFFEGGLIPMFLIIGIWGGARRVYSAFKFFLYTLLGSVLMLLALIALYQVTGTNSIPEIWAIVQEKPIAYSLQVWLWLAFLASFAVKLPMWPVHTWLPDAHVEAPTAGSIILAGVLLKMGGYGFLRFSLPMLPDASIAFAPVMWGLGVVAVIYTSLVALAQRDMKKLIAYSSVAHMGFVTIGLFALNQYGLQGAIFQMISHGLVSGALFFCVGVLYDRMHTREIAAYGGVVNVMPRFAVLFLFLTLASVGLPGTSGFIGEFLSLLGIYAVSPTVSLLTATGVVLGAAYMLWLYRRVMFGVVANDHVKALKEMTAPEAASLIAISIAVLWLGIHATPLLEFTQGSVDAVLSHYPAGGR